MTFGAHYINNKTVRQVHGEKRAANITSMNKYTVYIFLQKKL